MDAVMEELCRRCDLSARVGCAARSADRIDSEPDVAGTLGRPHATALTLLNLVLTAPGVELLLGLRRPSTSACPVAVEHLVPEVCDRHVVILLLRGCVLPAYGRRLSP